MSLFNKTARRLRTRDGKRTISLGVELVENRMLLANVIPVKTTVDNGNNTTPTADSLRAAIVAANETPDSTIVFQITSGASPFVINVTSTALLPITAETTIDATTNLGLPAVIQINGGGQAFDGLTLGAKSDHSTITGLNIADFGGAGIRVESANDTITDNLIGTDSTGLAAGPGNQVGIVIDGVNGGSAATIGGTVSGTANTIGFNTGAGVSISGTTATGNVVEGNFIGTDSAGSDLGNGFGIVITGGSTTIGGTVAGALAANVIGRSSAAGAAGVSISGGTNVVEGDFIGTNSRGADLHNTAGIAISGGTNTIGGTAAANVIGLNTSAGVSISGAAASTNVVEGNFIGTSSSGADLHNTVGIAIGGGTNTIGGTAAGTAAANVIGRNSSAGVSISGTAASTNVVEGNFIGTNGTGIDLGNGTGIAVTGATNTIGGTVAGALAANVIGRSSAAGAAGVSISGGTNVVEGNFIGTRIRAGRRSAQHDRDRDRRRVEHDRRHRRRRGRSQCDRPQHVGGRFDFGREQPGRRQFHWHERQQRQPWQWRRRHRDWQW